MKLGNIVPSSNGSLYAPIHSFRGIPKYTLHPAWTELDFDTITISGSNAGWDDSINIAEIYNP